MSIGNRRTRIKIIEVGFTEDTIGGQIPNRAVVKETWVTAKEITGTRAAEFQAIYNKQPVTFTMRTDSYPITTNNLIEYRGKECTIHSVVTDQLNKISTIQIWE